MKIVINKKCPRFARIYSNIFCYDNSNHREDCQHHFYQCGEVTSRKRIKQSFNVSDQNTFFIPVIHKVRNDQ